MPGASRLAQDEQGCSFQLLGMDLFNPGPCAIPLWRCADSQPDVSLNRADSLAGRPRTGEGNALTGKRASREPLCWGMRATPPLTPYSKAPSSPAPSPWVAAGDRHRPRQPPAWQAGRLDRIVFKLSEQEANTQKEPCGGPAIPMPPSAPLALRPISPALDASQLGDALALNLTALSCSPWRWDCFWCSTPMRFVQSVRRPARPAHHPRMPPRRALRWLTLEILDPRQPAHLLGLLLAASVGPRPMGQPPRRWPICWLTHRPAAPLPRALASKALVIGLCWGNAANLPGWWQLLRQSPRLLREGNSRPLVHPGNAPGLLSPFCCCAPWSRRPETSLWRRPRGRGWLFAMALPSARDALRSFAGRLHAAPHRPARWVAETLYHLDRTAIAVMALQLTPQPSASSWCSSFRPSVEIRSASAWPPILRHRPEGWLAAGAPSASRPSTPSSPRQMCAPPPAARRAPRPLAGQPIEWAQMDFIPELKAAYPPLAGAGPLPRRVLASEPLDGTPRSGWASAREVTSEGGRGLSPSPASIRITAATRGRYCMPSEGRCNPLPSSATNRRRLVIRLPEPSLASR